MRRLGAVLLAGKEAAQLQGAVESLECSGEPVDTVVLYSLAQEPIGAWCEERGLAARGYREGELSLALREALAERKGQDIFLMSAEMRCLPSTIARLQEALWEKEEIGAVIPAVVTKDVIAGRRYFKNLADYAEKQRRGERLRSAQINSRSVLLGRALLDAAEIDAAYLLPDNCLMDMALQGTEKGLVFYQLSNALVEDTEEECLPAEEAGQEQKDYCYIKEKWKMGYVLRAPSMPLLNLIKSPKPDIRVLEVGCSSGVNLMGVGNLYPQAELFGLEINPYAARMGKAFARVEQGNIEDRCVPFGENNFDYIIFGDVLEHLRDPQGTLEYCRTLLSEGGKIVASIPNLQHWSVLRTLIDGFFPYADFGLLDRTHIHFFTYYEIVLMFEAAGYRMLEVVPREMNAENEEDIRFIDSLMRLTRTGEEFMFRTFQYYIVAEKV